MENLILIGLNHKTAPVHIRECLTFSEPETRQALGELSAQPDIDEIVLFSTCNRVEILLSAKQPQSAIDAAKRFLAGFKQIALADFETNLYLYMGNEAVRHVFRVAASLDSMVVGEPQILGQMKQAYRSATEQKTSGVILNRLLHRTFFIAKRIRSETGIGDSAVSISYAAIELGRKIFGTLEGKRVLLIGAGEMAELAVEHLIRQRSGTIFVANRTFERGMALAKAYKGTAIRFEEVADHLNQVDIVISSTGAAGYVLEKTDIKAVMRGRRNRPIFFIDIAVPRDIDPTINALNNTYVYDIDDLQGVIDDNIQERRREAVKAERIIDEAVIQFRHWFDSLQVVPTIRALRETVRSMAVEEVKRTMPQLAHLSSDDQKAIERLVDATVNKILHHPTQYLKSNGCQGKRQEVLDVTRKLFHLDDE